MATIKHYSKLILLIIFTITLLAILSKVENSPFVLFIFIFPPKGTLDIAHSSKVPFVDKLLKKLYIEF